MRSLSIPIEKELVSSYLSYSLSVIIGRALPDIRDGLKPVQRRIIWTMWEDGVTSKSQYRKSAKIVGSCIGRYHPHGDKPVYDALVRLAQDFVMRYPLVDGQGNFGSIDGDEPAAMRYSEARMTQLAEELLKDIEEETVDFAPNYDETAREPRYLPARFPNLLVNGTSGIAVGMSTSIPPHNLGEVIDALIYLLEKPKASVDEIMKIIKGPDLPTGGIVVGDLKTIYKEGKGQLSIYSRYKIEKNGKYKVLVFYEVPYQQNKSKIVEKIAELIREKTLEGVVRVADESDRHGIRIAIDIKNEYEVEPIVAHLYEKAGLRTTFYVNMLVVDGVQPISTNLLGILQKFIDFRREVIIRRTNFRLSKAKSRLHILEGLLKAIDILDDIIDTIRNSENQEKAKQALVEDFGFSEVQAQAILDMRLGKLSRLESESIKKEYKQTKIEIEKLEKILQDPQELKKVMIEELREIKEKYADQRRSVISGSPPIKELKVSQELKVVVTPDFFVSTLAKAERIKRVPVRSAFITSGDLAVVSNLGKVYRVKIEKIRSWTEKGIPIKSLIRLSKNEDIVYVAPADEEKYLVFLSKKGSTRKFKLKDVYDLTARGEIIFELEEGDEIKDATECSEGDSIFFISESGMILGVEELEITSRISKAIELPEGTSTLCVVSKSKDEKLLVCATQKTMKMVRAEELKIQSKGGVGIILFPEKAGKMVDALFIGDENDEICITYRKDDKEYFKYIPAKKIPVLSRQAIGKEIVDGEIVSLGKLI